MKATVEIKALDTMLERIEWLEHKFETLEKLFNNHSLLFNAIEDNIKEIKNGKK